MVLQAVTVSQFFFPLVGCAVIVLLFLTTMLQPYKIKSHNHINIFFLFVTMFIAISFMAETLVTFETVPFKYFTIFMVAVSILIPLIYILGVILYKLCAHRMCVQNLYQALCQVCIKQEDDNFERILPERMVNVEECAALLSDPMEVRT